MKKTSLPLVVLAISTAAFFSFNSIQTSAIKGTVTPADKAVRAWAISMTDTFNVDIKDGVFEIKNVEAGTYSVIIEAEEPYANIRKVDVVVPYTARITDMGEIALRQKTK
jgi:hypothetical protein